MASVFFPVQVVVCSQLYQNVIYEGVFCITKQIHKENSEMSMNKLCQILKASKVAIAKFKETGYVGGLKRTGRPTQG